MRGLLTPRSPAAPEKGVLDLVLLVESRDYRKASLTSLFEAAFRATKKTPALRTEALEKLAALSAAQPHDYSVEIAVTLATLIEAKPDAARAVERLVEFTEATPLETLPAGTRANSRQRAEAFQQVALWLVARECLKQDALRALGEKLAARAAAGARRQLDQSYPIAILREWGQSELDRGDAQSAEARFSEMIDVVLPPPRKSAAVKTASGPAQKASARPATSSQAVTTEQFQQAVDIARLAAEKKMTALSLRAVRKALRGGPPIPSNDNSRERRIIAYSPSGDPISSEPASIETALAGVVRVWRKERASSEEIYNVLIEAVLPEARSEEVFLYSRQDQATGNQSSIGRLLAKAAVEAGQVEDLRRRALARAGQPLGELPAKVLLAHLAIESNDGARAVESLNELSKRLQKDTLQTTAELIGSVAMSAIDHKDLAAAALPLLERAAKNLGANSRFDQAQALLLRIVRFDLEAHDEPAARKVFEQIVDLAQKLPSRNADYYRSQQSQRLAQEYARAGWAADCLAELGKYFDTIPANPRFPAGDPTSPVLVPLARLLLDLPAEKRYETLKNWTLPTKARRSVRFATAEMPQFAPPAAFGRIPRPDGSTVSTAGLLIDAARQSGKLEELSAEIDALAKEKVENADALRLLVALARGQSATIEGELKQHLAEIEKRATEQPAQPIGPRYYPDFEQTASQVRSFDLLLARACLADPKAAAVGERMMRVLLGHAERTHNLPASAQALEALISVEALRMGAPDVTKSTGLPHWINATAGSVWAAQDGHVAHLVARSMSPSSLLLFDCPLAGTFEFSVDAYHGASREGNVGYAGLTFAPNGSDGNSGVWPIGAHERIYRVAEGTATEEFNRFTVQVAPGKVRCLVNGQLYYEDPDPAPTSPWLMLASAVGQRPAYRNFQVTGAPEVLREVPLSQGDSLGGWSSHIYPSQLPTPLSAREPEPEEGRRRYNSFGQPEPSEPPVYDWQAKNGEILGRKLDDDARDPVPSNLTYFRPLLAGETVRYEFFYHPGEFHVHPSLGRLAFLLETDGVRLHWLCDAAQDDWTGLAPDNALDEPAMRRGPNKLPLKADEWNTLQMAINDETLALELNGQVVYQRKLDEGGERMFGLFHYRDKTAARVRNVVLSGNWRRRFENLSEISFAAQGASAADGRARRTLIGEQVFGKSAGLVLRRVRELPPAERYRQLADWVLPGEARSVFQLAGEFTLLDAPSTIAAAPDGRRVLLGTRLDSPALELVKAAQEVGKIDELAERIEKADIPQGREFDERCRRALLTVVRVAQHRDADAEGLLRSFPELVQKLPVDAEGWERWPEYIAATAAASRPTLRAAALAIFDAQIAGIEASVKQKRPFSDRDEWSRIVRNARARLAVSDLPSAARRPFGSGPDLANWTPVAWAAADNRVTTRGVPHWTVQDGTLWHYPGYQQDDLYLRSPLVGDFELNCELTSFGWRESRIQYGGLRCDLHDTLKSFDLQALGRPARKMPIEPPLGELGDWYRYRLVVKDETYTAYVNDRKLCAEPLAVNFDPWLMVSAPYENTAGLRNLRLSGNPRVPDRLDIGSGFTLAGWRSDYPGLNWEKRGEEIYDAGKRPEPVENQPATPRRFPERALHYHRPLVEDGEVEYEFYYAPGKALVHPLLDRIAFLLEPDHVHIHRLTGAGYERSELKFDNVSDEPDNRRGPAKLPLKENAWNRAKLAVAGDTVSVSLNGVEVYQRRIESTNQRTFGLFHYADETEARVRNIQYRGNWPKQLPTQPDWLATGKAGSP
jgi:hypothetical protein